MDATDYHARHYINLGSLRNDFRNKNLFLLAASLVKGKEVLDVGCGSCDFAAFLQGQGKKVVGIEPNRKLVAQAKKKYPNLRIVVGDVDDLGKVRNRFSDITLLDVLEHIKEDRKAVERLRG